MATYDIYLSPPFTQEEELLNLKAVIESNWIAPVGTFLTQFEEELSSLFESKKVLCLQSGSAALQLALTQLKLEKGDEILTNTFSFCAGANAIIHAGGTPVFVDADPDDWNLDTKLLHRVIEDRLSAGKKIKGILCVHNYGMPSDMQHIMRLGEEYEIPIVEDAAESLGSTYYGTSMGGFGTYGCLSFNGNKIVTTGGGGALIVKDETRYKQLKHLTSQAKLPGITYSHDAVGYNLGLSNVLAALGVAQLQRLPQLVSKRRKNFDFYTGNINSIGWQVEKTGHYSNRWLSAILLKNSDKLQRVIQEMGKKRIEIRRLWTPLHLQKPYMDYPSYSQGVSERCYETGICLPSGHSLTQDDVDTIVSIVN